MKSISRPKARFSGEKGQALIIILVLLLLGSLTLVPVLDHAVTALNTGTRYEYKTDSYYAADGGIEDAMWQIKYDQLAYKFAGQNYQLYNFDTVYTYDINDPINNQTTTVSLQNVWIPTGEGVTPPDPEDALLTEAVLKGNKLMVSGTADVSTYTINISFTPDTEASDNLTVKAIGIWIPYGFSYAGSSDLESSEELEDYFQETQVYPHCGGSAVIWTFDPSAPFSLFPGFNELAGVQSAEINLSYSANVSGTEPAAIAWLQTEKSFLDGGPIEDILPVTWDIDTKVFHLTSTAGITEVEAYVTKCELRSMQDDMAGDYKATGNSLMLNNDHDSLGIRDYLLSQSSATISTIPSHAITVAAYLYWGAWYDEVKVLDELCNDYTTNNWTKGAGWTTGSGRYRGHSTTPEGDPARYLTSKTLDLSGLDPDAVVEVRWEQSEEGDLEAPGSPGADALYYSFSSDNGTTWSDNYTAFANDIDETSLRFTTLIPQQYWTSQFKLRFYFQGFTDTAGTDEYCRLDNIAVTWYLPTADQSVKFVINGHQVYFDEDGNPAEGLQELNASDEQWTTINNRRGFSYACKVDVTRLVQAFSNNGSLENPIGNGNGTYTVGNVDGDLNDQLAWGGWSLIVVYASPETAGHRIYLFDRTAFNKGYENLDFDYDGEPGGDISGFLVPDKIPNDPDPYAGHMTCFVGEGDDFITGDKVKFTGQSGYSQYLSNAVSPWYNVWNMTSPGMSFDGVDIDTFDIPWKNSSNQDLVTPGDTTAHLDLPSEKEGGYSGSDAWNLIYLVISLRSVTTTGGTTHYVIRNS